MAETYADLPIGFDVGTTMVYRYLREALHLLAAMAPSPSMALVGRAGWRVRGQGRDQRFGHGGEDDR